VLWVPSHSGAFPVALQPQKYSAPSFSALWATGVKPVSLCEPSQNGYFADRPQAHQK